MGNGEPRDPARQRYTVQSLVRAVGVLELLGTPAAAEGLSVTEVAERIGLSKSSTFAILHTLLGAGFVADVGSGQNRKYHLGRAIARLGERAAAANSITDLARPIMRELTDELQLSVRLGMVTRGAVEIIDRVEGPSRIRIDLRMGEHELLHCTAVGKAIMATWTDEIVLTALGSGPLEARTERTLTDPHDVLAELATVRTRGYALDDEEDFAGILCIGAAVPSGEEAGIYGISTTTLKASVSYERVKQIGTALRAGAERLGTALDRAQR